MSRMGVTDGFSDAARAVAKATTAGRRHLHESHALGIERTQDELAAVWNECRNSNWDGFQALPVSQDTLRNAYCLLESLPLGFPRPSVGAEPDGELTLEWHISPRRTLSVSVNDVGDLHYAALFGPSREYGTEAFFGELPDQILNLIARLYSA